MCLLVIDLCTSVAPKPQPFEKEEDSGIELLSSDLWTTLFRGGYKVSKLQRSLSGKHVSRIMKICFFSCLQSNTFLGLPFCTRNVAFQKGWPLIKGEINTFILRLTLASGLSRGVYLSPGVPSKEVPLYIIYSYQH